MRQKNSTGQKPMTTYDKCQQNSSHQNIDGLRKLLNGKAPDQANDTEQCDYDPW